MSRCISPFTKKDGITFPCGKCYNCRKRKASSWSFRLLKEAESHDSAFFVTLTYDEKHLPITPNNLMTLNKEDLKKFFRSMRKKHAKKYQQTFKYYAVGEYGENRARPHYHIILFSPDLQLVEETWKKGHIDIRPITAGRVGYTCKYLDKIQQIPKFERDDRLKEFNLMSKGLGANYLTPEMIKWHKADLLKRMYITLDDHQKIAMPRYYKNKIYTDWQLLKINKYLIDKEVEDYQYFKKHFGEKKHLEKLRKEFNIAVRTAVKLNTSNRQNTEL